MNRRAANTKSRASEICIGELRGMIAEARRRGGMSRVNPMFTMEQACDIYAAAIKDRPDDEVPAGMVRDVYRDGMKPSRDSLIIRNILRDCA